MNSNRFKSPGMNVGTSLVLVAFVLLCLVCFAGLSFSTADSDYRLSRQTADRFQEYLDACQKAETKISEVDQAYRLLLSMDSVQGPEDFLERLGEMSGTTVSGTESEPLVSFSIQVNETEVLDVSLRLYPAKDSANQTYYEVYTYKTRPLSF